MPCRSSRMRSITLLVKIDEKQALPKSMGHRQLIDLGATRLTDRQWY
jgi:hypothetical protein